MAVVVKVELFKEGRRLGEGNARRCLPSLSDVGLKSYTNWACHLNCDVVIRAMMFFLAIKGSARVIVQVLRAVPTLVAKVYTSTKGYLAIYYAELFVMGAAKGVSAIEDEVNSFMDMPPDFPLPEFSFKSVKVSVIPHEKVNLEVLVFAAKSYGFFFQRLFKG